MITTKIKFLDSKIKKISYLILASYFAFSLVSFSNLQAASQGSAGATSSGTVEVGIAVNRSIIIQGLRDFNFGLWRNGDGTLIDNDDVCVAKTSNFGNYGVRAAGNGDGFDPSAFTLSNGFDQINYNVYWNDETGTAGAQQLTPGLIQHGQVETAIHVIFAAVFGVCFNNANVQIEIPDTELAAAVGGAYSGTLTLLVIPD
jgi:spore coat protein U-like protein